MRRMYSEKQLKALIQSEITSAFKGRLYKHRIILGAYPYYFYQFIETDGTITKGSYKVPYGGKDLIFVTTIKEPITTLEALQTAIDDNKILSMSFTSETSKFHGLQIMTTTTAVRLQRSNLAVITSEKYRNNQLYWEVTATEMTGATDTVEQIV